ncbi:hypothetical protein BOTBODRAFT_60457 [Botryobasidium botryosum FD-172 SS1]|uniref:HMG box domain-containing protein n=1 Tax=Botryobasidium botryosum (strain FD-172 SS1) TaxID=930990 RepID=A0A067LWQ5_BOTB1|nr:hypothetical protein BOTBODRAFT_60457 [Botryobasidium botryosum FD-172 SS1]
MSLPQKGRDPRPSSSLLLPSPRLIPHRLAPSPPPYTMPKAAADPEKKTRKTKKSGEPKEKRPPTNYQLFMKNNITSYKESHPGISHKDAFKEVALLWKDAEENPNRGGTAPVKKPAAKKKAKKDEEEPEQAADAASDE